MAMNAMKSRQWSNLVGCLLWGILYPYVGLHGYLVLLMVNDGTILVGIVLLAWLFLNVGTIVNAVKLIRLRKKVLEGKTIGSGRGWRKTAWRYCGMKVLRLCAMAYLIATFFTVWSDKGLEKDYIPLSEYTEEVPFRTVQDLLSFGEVVLVKRSARNANTVRKWSDVLFPVNFEWDERGEVNAPDGSRLYGRLDAMYHETRGEWIAKWLVDEYTREAKKFGYESVDLELPEMDEVVAFSFGIQSDYIILRKGEKVLCADFYSSGDDSVKPELSEWAKKMAESLYE